MNPLPDSVFSDMASLAHCHDFIVDRVKAGCTYQQISLGLQQAHPGHFGLSSRSIRRYCCSNNIHRSSQLSDQELCDIVELAVVKVSG